MEKIHIFTDSSADIPEAQVEAHGIEIVPITVTHEGRVLREYYDITPEEYWKLLQSSRDIPMTAQVTPSQFLDTFRRAQERGCTHVLGVLINGNGSGTYQSACMARNLFYEEYGEQMHIELVDSATYTYIYGHIVVLAAELRDAGDNFEAILGVVKSRLNRVEAYLGVYSLSHLKKSGRISGGAAFVGEALGLKPISHVFDGKVDVCDKVRGEKAVVSGIIRKVSDRVVQPEKQNALLLYGDVPAARIEELEKRLFTELGFMGVTRCPIGVSVITNTGPQALAVAFYGRGRT
ncbi:DegV family protein [Agathobaculum sp. NTUH-O15-33]|uniref:DegV family protein n=1 Tax=Agathobaculum sp. NTUH-O15-33 TaxID=3079302 RepID=UPI0029584CFD|nr:DegV family protein [Agathobaculum sp. NTUH-O15-33]WNX85355.1 DegV family protein [Agathobaculum sp. NTUH-O15-33]